MKVSPRASESKTHQLTISPGKTTVLITRIKPPHLIVAYNIHSKEYVIMESDKMPEKKLDAAVTKAIAFAKHNIIE